MNSVQIGICVLLTVWGSISPAVASNRAGDGSYIPHGANDTAAFEEGLYKLNPLFARGISPAMDVVGAGVSKEDIHEESLSLARYYAGMFLSEQYTPSAEAAVIGLRGIYDGGDGILFSEKAGDGVRVEVTVTTTMMTLTFTSHEMFARSPALVSKQILLEEIGCLLNIPMEQIGDGEVEIKTLRLANIPVAVGKIYIPSPCDPLREGDMAFRGYNNISFWTIQGKLFLSLVPAEAPVARFSEIKVDSE